MTHPIITEIIELANPLAEELKLEIVGVVFQTNKQPPVLRVDIRHPNQETGLDDCEKMSRALEGILEQKEVIPGSYVLEVSSPGISRQIDSDREITSFRGFSVLVTTTTPYENHQQWRGRLLGRDSEAVYLNQKGRTTAIPRQIIETIQLDA